MNVAPPAAKLCSDHIQPLLPSHASPLAPHVVAKFTAWLQEDNHPHRALCQEDSEASRRPIKNYAVPSLSIATLSCYSSLIQSHLLSTSHLNRPVSTSLSDCCASP